MRNPLQANGIQRQRLLNFQSNYLVINALRGGSSSMWSSFTLGFAQRIKRRFGAAVIVTREVNCRRETRADYNYIIMQITYIAWGGQSECVAACWTRPSTSFKLFKKKEKKKFFFSIPRDLSGRNIYLFLYACTYVCICLYVLYVFV